MLSASQSLNLKIARSQPDGRVIKFSSSKVQPAFCKNILKHESKKKSVVFSSKIFCSQAEDTATSDDGEKLEFESKLGQNVRKGLQGWQTLVQVEKGNSADNSGDIAEEGDDVVVNFVCKTEDGDVLSSSEQEGPLTFEVGTRDFIGNPLFQGVDEAIRGFVVGQSTTVKACGGAYNPELLFKVPADHPEVQRLTEEFGGPTGLEAGTPVQLANGAAAVILQVDEGVVTIDSNHPLAGAPLLLEVSLMEINKGAGSMSKL